MLNFTKKNMKPIWLYFGYTMKISCSSRYHRLLIYDVKRTTKKERIGPFKLCVHTGMNFTKIWKIIKNNEKGDPLTSACPIHLEFWRIIWVFLWPSIFTLMYLIYLTKLFRPWCTDQCWHRRMWWFEARQGTSRKVFILRGSCIQRFPRRKWLLLVANKSLNRVLIIEAILV